MFGILLLLFTIVPATEFYLLFSIGSEIGAGNTFMIIILTGVVGAFLAKIEGLAILVKLQTELSAGKMPTNEIIHGFIVFGGGLLLLTPGFITDILGLCMVIPGTRHLIVLALMKYFKNGIASGKILFVSNMNYHSYQQEQDDKNVFETDFEKKDEWVNKD